MIKSCICYIIVVVSFFGRVRAGITTSDSFWTHQTELSTAAAGSVLGGSLKTPPISAKSVTQWNSTSNCSTAPVYGTSTVPNRCRHTPGTARSSQSTGITQSITNNTLATVTTGATNAFGEAISKVTAKSTAAKSDISATAQKSSTATTLTPLPFTHSRPSSLEKRPSSSVSIAARLSTDTVSNGLNLPALTLGHQVSNRVDGTTLATRTSSSLAIPTSTSLSISVTAMNNANATLSNATLAADANELQNQLLAAVALTQTWVSKSNETNSNNAVGSINGTILFAQVWTISTNVNTTYINIETTWVLGSPYQITEASRHSSFMFRERHLFGFALRIVFNVRHSEIG